VTALWDKSLGKTSDFITLIDGSRSRFAVPDGPPCEPDEIHTYYPKEVVSSAYYFSAIAIKVACPASVPAHLRGIVVSPSFWITFIPYTDTGLNHIPAAYFSPELLVTINFTQLGLDVTDSFGRTSKSTINIAVGLTDDIVDITSASNPVALFPGLKLVGGLSRNVRKRFDKPRASVLGLFTVRDLTPIRMLRFTNDLLIVDARFLLYRFHESRFGPITTGSIRSHIATLRIFDLYELTQWIVHADDHDKTVLDGFSSLGGLSSFVSTAFSAIFGTTLMLVIFGE
jgi:hypothetical protein